MQSYKTFENVTAIIDGKKVKTFVYGKVEEMTYNDPLTKILIELDFDPTQEEAYWLDSVFDRDEKGVATNLKVVKASDMKKVFKKNISFAQMMTELKHQSPT